MVKKGPSSFKEAEIGERGRKRLGRGEGKHIQSSFRYGYIMIMFLYRLIKS